MNSIFSLSFGKLRRSTVKNPNTHSMLFSEFIALLLRQKILIITITIAAVIAALTVQSITPVHFQTSQLYAISIRETETTNAYDLTKVADDFSQTLSGWAKTPTLADSIKQKTGSTVQVSGNTQTKQNFLLTITHDEPKKAAELATSATEALQKIIERYNAASKYKFAITLAGETTTASVKNNALVAGAAGIAGLTFGIAWALLSALLGGRVSTTTMAEEILGITAAVTFYRLKSKNLHFLDTLLKKNKRAVLVGMDFDVSSLSSKLEGKPTTARIPEDVSTLEGTPVLVVRLDITKVATLRAFRSIWDGEMKLVIWG